MTEEQVEIVRTTWSQVEPSAEQLAMLFYDRLFEIAPELRPLFKGDMVEQSNKLIQMLAMTVNSLARFDTIIPAVQEMGVRHTGYGVEAAHYDCVGAALLWTLDQGLGEDFTDDAREAWTLTYTTLASVMREAAARAAA